MDISILVSTRNRARQLQATLRHFERLQAAGLHWEMILVDNGSTDGTDAVIRAAQQRLPIVALHEPKPGKNRALNRGLPVATGQLLVFTDDDVLPDDDWLVELIRGVERWPDDSVFAGPIEPLFPGGTPDWLADPEFIYAGPAFGHFRPTESEGPIERRPFGGNLAIRAEALDGFAYDENIGPCGANYTMGSESELLRRLRAHSERFIYLPAVRVRHVIELSQLSLKWLFGRAYRHGRAHARFGQPEATVHLFDAPRYRWRKLAEAWVRKLFSSWRSKEQRFAIGRHYYELKGYLAEYRRIHGGMSCCSLNDPAANPRVDCNGNVQPLGRS